MIPLFEQDGCRWIQVDAVEPCDTIAEDGRYLQDREGDGRVQARFVAFWFEAGAKSYLKEASNRGGSI